MCAIAPIVPSLTWPLNRYSDDVTNSVLKDERRLHLSHSLEPRLSQPYGLTFHEGVVYWSEFEKGHIMKMELQTKNITLLLQENPQSFALKLFDRSKQDFR